MSKLFMSIYVDFVELFELYAFLIQYFGVFL